MNVLHQDTLILEDIAFGFLIQGMVAGRYKRHILQTVRYYEYKQIALTGGGQFCRLPCTFGAGGEEHVVVASKEPC